MQNSGPKKIIENLLNKAGVQINGPHPWDIHVKNEGLYRRILSRGTLGFGEAYMDGWWDSEQLDEMITKILRAELRKEISFNWPLAKAYLQSWFLNLQNKRRSKVVAEKHYDLSNELYMSFLDPYNQYTCGYFKDTTDLNVAQLQKLRLICEKLQLKATDKVLDIGCGWGGFAKYAAEHYGCHVTGITISKEQAAFARSFTQGLPVDIQELDYRHLSGKFDKVLICGMIEHVGYKNYPRIFKIVYSLLPSGGLFLLHTIASSKSETAPDPWIDKYIFPNGILPSLKQLSGAAEGLFVAEDLHNFGAYYDPTLIAWFKNFDASWPKLKQNFDDRFYRMWKYYLLSCAAIFRSREAQLYQFVFSKQGVLGGYITPR